MRFLSCLVLICLIATGCASPPQPHATAPSTQPPGAPVLYVHLIAPRYVTTPATPPRRIVTARIHLGEDFAVALGDPVAGIGSSGPLSYSADTVLAGRVDRDGDKFGAHLVGKSFSSTSDFAGTMTLDTPVNPQGGGFSGGYFPVKFVLSASPDCSPYLKE